MKKAMILITLGCFLLPSIALAGELASKGMATDEIEPDQLLVRITIQVDADEQSEVAEGASELTRTVEKALGKLPKKEVTIQTTGLRISPVYYYKKKTRSISYYTASLSWSVKGSAIDEILEMVNSLSSRDYEEKAYVRVDGLTWSLTPSLKEKTTERLIAQAVKSARAKAQTALGALDLKLKKILRIDLEDAGADRIEVGMMARRARPAVAAFSEMAPEPKVAPELHRGKIAMEVEAVMVVEF